MKRARYLGILLIGTLVGLAGCSPPSEALASKTKTDEGRQAIAVEVVPVSKGEVTDSISVVGCLSPKFEVDMRSEYAGKIDEVFVTEWVKVKKGDPLARLDTRLTEALVKRAQAEVESAKAEVLRAEVTLNRARREYDRVFTLSQQNVEAPQKLDDIRQEKEAAEAGVAAAKARLDAAREIHRDTELRLEKSVMRAPIDGTVSFQRLNAGDMVEGGGGGRVLLHIVDNRLLNLTLSVPSQHLSRLKVGQSIDFTSDGFPGRDFTGTLMYINASIDSATRSVQVIAEVPNESEELRGGLFARGQIQVERRTEVLLAPQTALGNWDWAQRTAEVFVVEGTRARKRTIETGVLVGEKVEVRSGLSPEEKVVIRGGFLLRDGDRIEVMPAGGSDSSAFQTGLSTRPASRPVPQG